MFTIVSLGTLALLLIHPFIPKWLPTTAELNWTRDISVVLILLIVIGLTTAELSRARDVEVELRSTTDIRQVLSLPMMEMKIKELKASPKRKDS